MAGKASRAPRNAVDVPPKGAVRPPIPSIARMKGAEDLAWSIFAAGVAWAAVLSLAAGATVSIFVFVDFLDGDLSPASVAMTRLMAAVAGSVGATKLVKALAARRLSPPEPRRHEKHL